MQSYMQGFVTGGIFCFAFLVLSSSTQQEPSCDINLEMIKRNKKQIETIWGAIETLWIYKSYTISNVNKQIILLIRRSKL